MNWCLWVRVRWDTWYCTHICFQADRQMNKKKAWHTHTHIVFLHLYRHYYHPFTCRITGQEERNYSSKWLDTARQRMSFASYDPRCTHQPLHKNGHLRQMGVTIFEKPTQYIITTTHSPNSKYVLHQKVIPLLSYLHLSHWELPNYLHSVKKKKEKDLVNHNYKHEVTTVMILLPPPPSFTPYTDQSVRTREMSETNGLLTIRKISIL